MSNIIQKNIKFVKKTICFIVDENGFIVDKNGENGFIVDENGFIVDENGDNRICLISHENVHYSKCMFIIEQVYDIDFLNKLLSHNYNTAKIPHTQERFTVEILEKINKINKKNQTNLNVISQTNSYVIHQTNSNVIPQTNSNVIPQTNSDNNIIDYRGELILDPISDEPIPLNKYLEIYQQIYNVETLYIYIKYHSNNNRFAIIPHNKQPFTRVILNEIFNKISYDPNESETKIKIISFL